MMSDSQNARWNCLLGWLAALLSLIIFVSPADRSTTSGMPYLLLGGIATLITFGCGYPIVFYAMKWLRRNQHTPPPIVALGIGVVVSQIVLLGIAGAYFGLLVREEGTVILWSILISLYDGSSTVFAAAAAITGGLTAYLTAKDLQKGNTDRVLPVELP
jgi:hypothetical protein